MIVTIGKKDYSLSFGFDFINELDKFHFAEINGIKYGMGLTMLLTGLADENPTALRDLIKAGLSTEPQKPTNKEVEEFIMELADQSEEGLNPVFESYLEEVKKQPLLKGKVQKFLKNLNNN